MFEITRSELIAAGPEAIWPDIVEPERFASWYAFCDTVEVPDADHWVLIGSWGSQRSSVTVAITDVTQGRRYGWRHVAERLGDHPAPRLSSEVQTSIELAPVDGGTEVTITSQMTAASRMGAIMTRMMGKRQVGNMFEQSLTVLASRHRQGEVQ